MTLHPGAENNSDCDLINQLWGLLSNPASGEWYLGSIIKNGLRVPELGIDIAPFPTIDTGDIPAQTMFEWALEHLAIGMSGTVLRGLDTFAGGGLHCTPVSELETEIDLTLNFGKVVFAGGYDVGASGVTGCALATAATILGNPPSVPGLEEGPDARLQLATWYRDDPKALSASENGQVSVGTYYLHEDTIEKVTTSDKAVFYRQRLAAEQQKETATSVTAATGWWKAEQSGEKPPGPAPEMGDTKQYAGGFQTYTYLNMAVQAMREEAGLALEPGNEYSDLQNAMSQFHAQVKRFQRDYPEERPAAEVMAYVANAEPVAAEHFENLGVPGIPVHDPETGDVVDHVPHWPVDRERALRAYAARVPQDAAPQDWFHVKGTFEDRATNMSAGFNASFTNDASGDHLVAKARAARLDIPNLEIVLGNKAGFDKQPGLYDRVATWIANTQSFQDTLKSKINAGLNSQSTLDALTKALNAGLKKLGFQ